MGLSSIPKKDCIQVSEDILKNSNLQWKSACSLAEMGNYGAATSHLIISTEELVKSLIVFFDGKGFSFRDVEGIDVFFKDHKIRYFIAYSMFAINIFGEELVGFIKKAMTDKSQLTTLRDEWKNDRKAFDNRAKNFLLRKTVTLKNEFKWFSKVDISRQDGFYSDYKDRLKTPAGISPEDYREVHIRLEKVRKVGIEIIDSFNSGDELIQKQLVKLIEDFNKEGYYLQIAKSLASLKENRGGPFELIKKSMI